MHTWRLGLEHRDAAVRFALSDDRWPRQPAGPIHLVFAYHFDWKAFPDELPERLASRQHGTCMQMLNFYQRKLLVAPNFVFPVPV